MAVVVKIYKGPLNKVLLSRGGAVGKYMTRNGDKVIASAQALSPVDTGKYKNSFKKSLEEVPTGIAVVVRNTTPYAIFVEKDTKPHIIVPRNAKVLRFPKNGKIVFAARVKHPGSRGQSVLLRALRSLRV